MTDSKITLREKVGYSLGDVAANLVFQMMMIFQLKFYTDIFGLDGAIAGSVLLVARIADAVSGIQIASSIIPALFFCIGVVAVCYYPITKQFNEKMQSELAERRQRQ